MLARSGTAESTQEVCMQEKRRGTERQSNKSFSFSLMWNLDRRISQKQREEALGRGNEPVSGNEQRGWGPTIKTEWTEAWIYRNKTSRSVCYLKG